MLITAITLNRGNSEERDTSLALTSPVLSEKEERHNLQMKSRGITNKSIHRDMLPHPFASLAVYSRNLRAP